MIKDCLEKLESIEPLINIVNNEEITCMAKFLTDRIKHPDSYLVFLGETSSGKSTIINSLMNDTILPMRASPTTAAITEVELCDDINEDGYFAINKNATIENISKKTFLDLCENPDSNLKRLRLKKKSSNKQLNGLRIFDTPGYNSIVEEHEEVLKEFLPNSDIIIYTVAYKVGIQDEDFVFLRFLKELIRDDVEIILVINRCPEECSENNSRIKEIQKYVSDILATEPKTFLIKNVHPEENEIYAIPKVPELWEYVDSMLNGEKRIKNLEDAFNQYIIELFEKCDSIIQTRYNQCLMTDKEIEGIIKLQKETAERIRKAVPDLIEPTFEDIKQNIPQKFDNAANKSKETIIKSIKSSTKASKDEIVAYTNAHLLPHVIKVESDEITRYLDLTLTDLSNKVDDYLNKEFRIFTSKIEVQLNTNTELAARNVGERILQKLATNGLGRYFSAFGGAGGSGAGIANAASHLLKKIGELFGKTFSKETHNMLKHILSKIGATSMKAVSLAISIILELLVEIVDYNTWQQKLEKKVVKAVDKWKKDTIPKVNNDLNVLCKENKNVINEIANNFETSFDDERPKDMEKCKKDAELSNIIRLKIGA